jgi:hypothetical protein
MLDSAKVFAQVLAEFGDAYSTGQHLLDSQFVTHINGLPAA